MLTLSLNEKSLDVISAAVALLDMASIGVQLNRDEIRTTLQNLRTVRAELIEQTHGKYTRKQG